MRAQGVRGCVWVCMGRCTSLSLASFLPPSLSLSLYVCVCVCLRLTPCAQRQTETRKNLNLFTVNSIIFIIISRKNLNLFTVNSFYAYFYNLNVCTINSIYAYSQNLNLFSVNAFFAYFILYLLSGGNADKSSNVQSGDILLSVAPAQGC